MMKWIKCSERLPDPLKDDAIFLVRRIDWRGCALASFQDGEWTEETINMDGRKINDVSHWMPIPELLDDQSISDEEDTQP